MIVPTSTFQLSKKINDVKALIYNIFLSCGLGTFIHHNAALAFISFMMMMMMMVIPTKTTNLK